MESREIFKTLCDDLIRLRNFVDTIGSNLVEYLLDVRNKNGLWKQDLGCARVKDRVHEAITNPLRFQIRHDEAVNEGVEGETLAASRPKKIIL